MNELFYSCHLIVINENPDSTELSGLIELINGIELN